MNSTQPNFQTFSSLAAENDILAIAAVVNFDHETPVALADRFLHESHFFLLESATAGPGNIARYSFLGFDPLWSWESSGRRAMAGAAGEATQIDIPKGPMAGLRSTFGKLKFASVNNPAERTVDITQAGGAVGFFTFDVASTLEPSVGQPPPKNLDFPDSYYFVPKNFLVVDHLTRKLTIIRHIWINSKVRSDLLSSFQEERDALGRVIHSLKGVHVPPPLITNDRPLQFDRFQSQMTEEEFVKKAKTCLNHIRKGDIFQIQIGNRLSAKSNARPFDIFRHLRMLNPSPYMFFYKFGAHHILGASPEIMVNVSSRTITHRPIAGTRRRTWNPQEDARMKAELENSPKERAEHVMLVDLSRNDIGRLAKPGKVKVESIMQVESYSHVFHLVSQVSGELSDDKDTFDAIEASFPNGTVCGAPKIRAIELIYQLEDISREFYAGSLGIFDFSGDLKSTLLIRTIHVRDQIASTQASAGIVYDSVPEHEWLETRNKMAACLLAIQNTLA